jgi:PhnB protein
MTDTRESAVQITNYLFFDGQCAEAFRFYAQTLGGKLERLLTAGESPAGASMPAEARNRIMNAYLSFGDQALRGSDWMAERPYEPPQGFYVSLSLEAEGEARRIFKTLAEGGAVRMPIEKTFFAACFGMLVDRFGIPWMIIGRRTP